MEHNNARGDEWGEFVLLADPVGCVVSCPVLWGILGRKCEYPYLYLWGELLDRQRDCAGGEDPGEGVVNGEQLGGRDSAEKKHDPSIEKPFK